MNANARTGRKVKEERDDGGSVLGAFGSDVLNGKR